MSNKVEFRNSVYKEVSQCDTLPKKSTVTRFPKFSCSLCCLAWILVIFWSDLSLENKSFRSNRSHVCCCSMCVLTEGGATAKMALWVRLLPLVFSGLVSAMRFRLTREVWAWQCERSVTQGGMQVFKMLDFVREFSSISQVVSETLRLSTSPS